MLIDPCSALIALVARRHTIATRTGRTTHDVDNRSAACRSLCFPRLLYATSPRCVCVFISHLSEGRQQLIFFFKYKGPESITNLPTANDTKICITNSEKSTLQKNDLITDILLKWCTSASKQFDGFQQRNIYAHQRLTLTPL